jgi:hypothetical protein
MTESLPNLPDPTTPDPQELDDVVVDVDAEAPEEDAPTADQALRYYGVDFDVEGIVRRFGRGDLIVPSFDPAPESNGEYEGFQRRFVWPKKQMDRFVESLLLGYPVPGIFLVEEANRRFLILDGQQRIVTLHAFYKGVYGPTGRQKVFKLENVSSALKGLTYETLAEPDRRLLDSTILQATVVVPRGKDLEPVYRVFERINSSGIKLMPQEIRVALYSGDLIKLIRDLNTDPNWREMFGPLNTRLKDNELILRYLALLEHASIVKEFDWDRGAARNDPERGEFVYKPAMASYLNSYLGRHRNLNGLNGDELASEFHHVVAILNEAAGRLTLRLDSSQVNAAQTDAIMVGAALAMRHGASVTAESAKVSINALRGLDDFRSAVLDSTSHAENVNNRLKLAYEQFASDAS